MPEVTTIGADMSTMPLHDQVLAEQAERVSTCAIRFSELDEHERERLRIPADRLNASRCAGINTVDAAIDLGIALESLYGPFSDKTSIGHLLRTRVSAALGGSARQRRKLGATVTSAYDLRSRAVHAGRFDVDEEGRKKWADAGEVLGAVIAGQSIVARSLERFTLEGVPEWPDDDASPIIQTPIIQTEGSAHR